MDEDFDLESDNTGEAAAKSGAQRQKHPSVLSVYLGSPEESERRMEALDDLTKRLGLRGRSTLIQWIADGRLLLIQAIADGRLLLVTPPTPYTDPADLSSTPLLVGSANIDKADPEQVAAAETPQETERTQEIQSFIADHIGEFVREERGWHMELAQAVVDHFRLPIGEIDHVKDMVHDEARRRGLPPYYDESFG